MVLKYEETRYAYETQMPPPLLPTKAIFFRKLWPWYVSLTLTDDLDCGTKERVLPQGIYLLNMKALSFTIQKLWQM